MSRKDFEEVMMIGSLRKSLNDISENLGTNLTIQVPESKAEQFKELQRKYDSFYEMPLEDRIAYSEIGGTSA